MKLFRLWTYIWCNKRLRSFEIHKLSSNEYSKCLCIIYNFHSWNLLSNYTIFQSRISFLAARAKAVLREFPRMSSQRIPFHVDFPVFSGQRILNLPSFLVSVRFLFLVDQRYQFLKAFRMRTTRLNLLARFSSSILEANLDEVYDESNDASYPT